jgi:SSS family transporter
MPSGGWCDDSDRLLEDRRLNEPAAMPTGGLESLDYAAVVLYLLLTFGITAWFGRRQKNTDDFFLGGRRMPWLAVGLSIIATLFSTLSYLGVPGEMIKQGVGMFLGYLSVPFSFIIVAWLWIPFFMRLRLTSAYEYLERRFSFGVRLLGASLFILLRLGWMSMVVYAASMALRTIVGDLAWLPGVDLYWWIFIIGLVAAVYMAIGGIQAAIWVDVVQCLLLLSGVLLAIGVVVATDGTGPADWWRAASEYAPRHTAPAFFSTDVTERNVVVFILLNVFFWNICTHGSDQVVLQRYFSTPSLAAARRSFLTSVCVDISMACLLSLAGLALLAFYIRHGELLPEGSTAVQMADKLFPHFLGHQLPAGCAGLVLSAFLCDAIQTLESGVNAITAVVTRDLFSRQVQPPEAARVQLRVARLLTLLVAALVTGAAYVVAILQETLKLSLVDMMPKFFNMFVGPLAALFFVGMFVPRATTRSVVPAAAIGLVVSVLWSWWEAVVLLFTGPLEPGEVVKRPTIFLAIAVPCLTTFGLAALFSLFGSRAAEPNGAAYTWWAIVRPPVESDASSDGPAPA